MLAEMLGPVTPILVCKVIWTVHVIVIKKSMTSTLSAPNPPQNILCCTYLEGLAVGRGWDN